MKHCETCTHWQPSRALVRIEDKSIGECHAAPPPRDFNWPRTKATDHCGSHHSIAAFAQRPITPCAQTADLALEPTPAVRKPKPATTKAAR